MSNYKNFIRDFPVRCGEILAEYQEEAEINGREVTFMLSIAAAALPIPFERLQKSPDGIEHPSGDKENYPRAKSTFDNLCGQKFLGSKLWDKDPECWQSGEVEGEIVKNDPPETWAEDVNPASSCLRVKSVLKHLRNALAHGNIFTLPDSMDEIRKIIFLNRIMCGRKFTGKYSILTVSPADFNDFLINWVNFLKDLKLDPIA